MYCVHCETQGPQEALKEKALESWNEREPEHESPRDMGLVGQDGLP